MISGRGYALFGLLGGTVLVIIVFATSVAEGIAVASWARFFWGATGLSVGLSIARLLYGILLNVLYPRRVQADADGFVDRTAQVVTAAPAVPWRDFEAFYIKRHALFRDLRCAVLVRSNTRKFYRLPLPKEAEGAEKAISIIRGAVPEQGGDR